MGDVDEAIEALNAGHVIVLPTDTVYGLAADPEQDVAVRRLSELKQRIGTQPIALVAASVEALLDRVPELRGRDETIARTLLPGPYTLVLGNPARRLGLLVAERPETIGVRVPVVAGDAAVLLERVGAVAATSANVHGGPDPSTLAEVPEEIRSAAAAAIDGGKLPGTASTVIDFTGREPRVLREGAAPSQEAIDRAFAALS
jgi:L-threonylcarbamoyladenylate synthase